MVRDCLDVVERSARWWFLTWDSEVIPICGWRLDLGLLFWGFALSWFSF